MSRPTTFVFNAPQNAAQMPKPIAPAGKILDTNASWRTEKPVIDVDTCIFCLRCYLVCPEGTIYQDNDTLHVDYDFCKGCGICANECPKKCIAMVREER